MYKKVLVPLDGSALAECALEHARVIATGCGVAEVDLIFVVEPLRAMPYDEGTTVPMTGIEREAEDKNEAWGKDYVTKIAKGLQKDGVAAKGVVLKGNPSEHILDYAAKNSVDLIVMSTHGRSGTVRWALGSVADKVIRLSPVPVMIVRSHSIPIQGQ